MMQTEKDKKRIREFLELLDNEKYELRRYSHPVLVYEIAGNDVRYSLWEEDVLERYGLQNVDGWDFEEDTVFCPDWVLNDDDDDDDLDDDDEDF